VGPNYIALAIPFFFLLIAVELAVAARRGRRVYRFADAIADLGCGVTQRVLLLFFEGLLLAAYVALYRHARVVDLATHPITAWVVAFLYVDLSYYWWHRASHRVNFLWAAHVVHHQSEDYNLAVALRQAVLTPVTGLPFSLPLALLGVPPLLFVTADALSTLYQFWIHTELVGRLGPLEGVLNTPSHHRVHHGRNAAYLDRNYGAVLIVWDRLFGTYAPEREPPTYGITKPLRSFNALWAQLEPWVALAGLARGARTWRERLAVWLAPPERAFPWQPHPAPVAADKHDARVSPAARAYVTANFALVVVATFCLMWFAPRLSAPALVVGALLTLLTTLTVGGLVEKKSWARPLEAVRLVALVGVAVAVVATHQVIVMPALATAT
jgi:sterol desaturase/sphingolipid hydroxylase (fatty acid hydroxylase superfamily)